MAYLQSQPHEPQRAMHSPSVYSEDENTHSRWSRISFAGGDRHTTEENDHQNQFSFLVQENIPSPLFSNPKSFSPRIVSVERELPKGSDQLHSTWQPNRDLRTRNLCTINLGFAWFLGIAAIVVGARIYIVGRIQVTDLLLDRLVMMGSNAFPLPTPKPGKPPRLWISGHRVYLLPEAAMIVVALLLNVALTLVLDGINYIPSTTLRWALKREGRLDLNSNPRLFICSKTFAPNGRLANILSAIALVMAYGGTSVLTYQIYVLGFTNGSGELLSSDVAGPRFGLDFNAWGCIGVGIGLIIQTMIATWSLVMSGKLVPTWSSNPLGTARACVVLGDERARHSHVPENKSFLDTPISTLSLDAGRTILSRPQTRQPPMAKYAPQVRLISNVVWFIAIVLSCWTITVGVFAWHLGRTDPAWVEASGWNLTPLAYWQFFGQLEIQYSQSIYKHRKDWLGLIIQCLVLAIITLGLHAVESITNVMRDEAIWRKATSEGVSPDRSTTLEGLSNWPCWVLFVFKSLTHWIYGYAFSTDLYVFMSLLPLIALTTCFIILGLFTEFLVRWKPKGAQPATYGDMDRLLGLVDEWNHDLIFWGDKGASHDGIRRAGTAGRRLADLDVDAWYVNLLTNSSSYPVQGPVTEIGKAF